MLRAKRFKPKPPSESIEQQALAYQVRSHLDRWPVLAAFASVPNQAGRDREKPPPGSPSGAMLRQQKMLREGMSPGYPDTLLDLARGCWHGFRAELKKSADWNDRLAKPYAAGMPTPDQIGWHERLTRNGYLVIVSYGWEPAWALMKWYIALPEPWQMTDRTRIMQYDHPLIPDTPRTLIYELPRS